VAWPKSKEVEALSNTGRPTPNSAKRRSETSRVGQGTRRLNNDEFGDGDLDDNDLLAAMADEFEDDFQHIDDYANGTESTAKRNTTQISRTAPVGHTQSEWEPKQLANGKWACNHRCKDRTACKHMCCREGLDKPPKAPKKLSGGDKTDQSSSTQQQKTLPKGQTTLSLGKGKQAKAPVSAADSDVAQLDLTQGLKKPRALSHVPGELKRLETLHSKTTGGRAVATPTFLRQTNTPSQPVGSKQRLSFLPEHERDDHRDVTSDYSDDWLGSDLPDLLMLTQKPNPSNGPSIQQRTVPEQSTADELDDFPIGDLDDFGDSDSLMNAAMVGLADSQELQASYGPTHPGRFAESESDDFIAVLEDTSATIMPDTPKLLLKEARKTPPPSESSFRAPSSHFRNRPRAGPFVDTNSDVFVTPGSKLRPAFSMGDGEPSEPLPKRIKTSTIAEKEKDHSMSLTPLADASDIEMVGQSDEQEAKQRREDIDQWFMQEFGQYVEFT
jgi:ATP-dependent DNA helicase HFM1/MER3